MDGDGKTTTAPSFRYFFRTDVLILQLMGFSAFKTVFSNNEFKSSFWDDIYFFSAVSMILSVILCQLNAIFYIGYGLDISIEIISSMCALAVSTIKEIRWWTRQRQLYDILQQLSIQWNTCRTHNFLTMENIKTAEDAKLIRGIHLTSVGFVFIAYAIRPYIMYLNYRLHQNTNDSFSYYDTTAIPAAYPIAIESFQKFFIVVSYEQIIGFFICMYWASTDALFIQLTSHISIQFKILAKRLDNIVVVSDHFNRDDYIRGELKNIAKLHHQLFLYCKSTENIYNPIILLTVLSNGISLCSCLYLAEDQLSSFNWSQALKSVSLLVSLVIQTLIYCSYADHLTQSVEQVCHSAYNSQWINWSQKNKRTLIIIIMRAAKEYQWTAYGMIILNLKQATTIANGALSYFMLLKSFR